MVTEALVLAHYKQNLRIIVKTNFFDSVSKRVFFQLGKDELLHYIIFFSKNLNLTEYNYEIYGKKLLTIIPCFK